MFSYETTVSYSRTDRNGKVPMHEILNLLQDCSTFHSEDICRGVSYMKREARAWVLVAYKVIVNRPIMFGQKITIGTSPSKFSSMFASRQYFIKDENGDYLVTTIAEDTRVKAAGTKTGTKTSNYYSNGKIMWSVSVKGTFTYNGSSAKCTSSSVSTTCPGTAWRISSKSSSKSGNKAIGKATANKYQNGVVIYTKTAVVTLSCSINGTLS